MFPLCLLSIRSEKLPLHQHSIQHMHVRAHTEGGLRERRWCITISLLVRKGNTISTSHHPVQNNKTSQAIKMYYEITTF